MKVDAAVNWDVNFAVRLYCPATAGGAHLGKWRENCAPSRFKGSLPHPSEATLFLFHCTMKARNEFQNLLPDTSPSAFPGQSPKHG